MRSPRGEPQLGDGLMTVSQLLKVSCAKYFMILTAVDDRPR